jgi:hypothetical protein
VSLADRLSGGGAQAVERSAALEPHAGQQRALQILAKTSMEKTPKRERERAIVITGQQWAEEQNAAGVPSSWVATWEDAIATGRAPDDLRHNSAKLCAASARSTWRSLRPDAPPPGRPGNLTGKRGRRPAEFDALLPRIMCTAVQRSAWEDAADLEGSTLSDWVRDSLDLAAKGKRVKR